MSGPALVSTPQRLLSLDVLRGLTIAFMIMVNNTGGEGAWTEMRHADWNGFTATDLVFPTFLFVVGVSIVFSIEARLKRGDSRAKLAWHSLRRAAVLYMLGVLVNGFPHYHLAHLRFYGVLQRIAVCYLIVSLLYLWDRRVWTKVALLCLRAHRLLDSGAMGSGAGSGRSGARRRFPRQRPEHRCMARPATDAGTPLRGPASSQSARP